MMIRKIYFLAVIASLVFIVHIPTAHAALDQNFFDSLTKLQINWAMFIELAVTVSFIFYPIVSTLLDPQVFLDISGGGQQDLLLIWQVSRDIMNTIFAFLLVAGAMTTVVMAKADFMKKFALKFILGVILVNFSWFFPRVILDVSHVLTANIYQLPSIIGTQCRVKDSNGALQPCTRPTKFEYFPEEGFIDSPDGRGFKCISDMVCYKPVELDPDANVADGILAGLMMNHARLPDINTAMSATTVTTDAKRLDMIRQSVVVVVRSGLQLLMVLYIAIIIVGMAVALLVRIPILWMTMAFMPLMFLGFVVGDLMDAKFNTMNLIFKKFVHAAFLPAAMAIPLTVGFILINALAFGPPPDSAGQLADATGNILPGIGDMWSFLWMLISIIVMWKGFRMALSIDPTFEAATKGLTDFGANVGNLAKNAPLNIPFLPGGKDLDGDGKKDNISLGQANAGLSTLSGLSNRGQLLSNTVNNAGGGGPIVFTPTSGAGSAIANATFTNGQLDQVSIEAIARAVRQEHANADPQVLAEKVRDQLKKNHSGFVLDATQFDKLKDEIEAS